MAGTPRLCVTNRIQAPATVLTASSAQAGHPVSWLKDQFRSKSWRSAIGWTIVAGENDKIDFNRSGVKAATIAAGTYATGALLCTAVAAALEAADATPVWACYYTGLFKFQIASDLAFTLLLNSGANRSTSCFPDLGFSLAADTGSATLHEGGTASYQSRHWVTADLGSDLAAGFQAVVAINHNSGAGGLYEVFANDSNSFRGSVLVGQGVSGDAAIRILFHEPQNPARYWRLQITDCSNPLGYAEVGVWFVGAYTQPTVSYAIGFTKKWEELSEVTVAISGAHFQDEKARRPTWGLAWSEIVEADRAALAAAFALVPAGRCFFFSFDAIATPTDTEYGFLVEGVSETLTSGLYFDVALPTFAGALG